MSDRYRLPAPKCHHVKLSTQVSSHDDLSTLVCDRNAVPGPGGWEPHASVWVCHREPCIEDAKAWVWASTHRTPIVKRKEGHDG